MKVVLIGSGNVAYSLAEAISKSENIELSAIYSRNRERGEELSNSHSTKYISDINLLPEADIYLLAVSDNSLKEVCRMVGDVVSESAIVAHTSGAAELLEGKKYARFYPLQTFTYGIFADFKKITTFIEAKEREKELKLITLSQEIAHGYELIDGQQLKVVHLAATFANNFTNRIFHYAEQILSREAIGREVLYPLMEESIEKIKRSKLPINRLQSGAAARGDRETIDAHRELIAGDEELRNIYDTITNTICNDKF